MKGYVIMESEFNLKLVFLSLRKKLIPICCITLVTALLSLAVVNLAVYVTAKAIDTRGAEKFRKMERHIFMLAVAYSITQNMPIIR